MNTITTHVLDLQAGRPARGVQVKLEYRDPQEGWVALAEQSTDDDGRVRDLLAAKPGLRAGVFRLTFAVGEYFDARRQLTFYPEITVVFEVREPDQHHHVPLLLSPFGYSTYRGS